MLKKNLMKKSLIIGTICCMALTGCHGNNTKEENVATQENSSVTVNEQTDESLEDSTGDAQVAELDPYVEGYYEFMERYFNKPFLRSINADVQLISSGYPNEICSFYTNDDCMEMKVIVTGRTTSIEEDIDVTQYTQKSRFSNVFFIPDQDSSTVYFYIDEKTFWTYGEVNWYDHSYDELVALVCDAYEIDFQREVSQEITKYNAIALANENTRADYIDACNTYGVELLKFPTHGLYKDGLEGFQWNNDTENRSEIRVLYNAGYEAGNVLEDANTDIFVVKDIAENHHLYDDIFFLNHYKELQEYMKIAATEETTEEDTIEVSTEDMMNLDMSLEDAENSLEALETIIDEEVTEEETGLSDDEKEDFLKSFGSHKKDIYQDFTNGQYVYKTFSLQGVPVSFVVNKDTKAVMATFKVGEITYYISSEYQSDYSVRKIRNSVAKIVSECM